MVDLPADFAIGFDIIPDDTTVSDWGSIIHLSATGNDCCAHGDRIPAVWFNPSTRVLTVVDGDATDGNSQCNPTESLPPNVVTHVRIEVRSNHVEVWLNDQLRCTADRSGDRREFTGVTVYASDPFYTPAAASINNFYLAPLDQVVGCTNAEACNYDPHAVVDDGTCYVARQLCVGEYLVPTTEAGCRAATIAAGLALGGNGYEFVGNYGTKGW